MNIPLRPLNKFINPITLREFKDMGGIKSLIFLQLIYLSTCMDQLQIRYEWKQLDYDFPTPEDRQRAIEDQSFIPENNVPMGLEVWGDRLFITVLRWKPGVPSSLNYIKLNDANTSETPKLIPYPNWAAHQNNSDGSRDINAPYRMRVDRCDRLWVMDNGLVGRGDNLILYTASIFVFDLKSDKLLRKYVIPEDQVGPKPGFGNIALEDDDCDNTYAYAADYRGRTLLVYSWDKNESWKIKHEYFDVDPNARNFLVNGYEFHWNDGILGVALSGPNADGFNTLYFHAMTSFEEFSVSTKYLRSKAIAENSHNAFKRLGTRGPDTQTLSSCVDNKNKVLFYALVNQNAVGCWRTSNKVYNPSNQGLIYKNNNTMALPIDLRVDNNNNIWVMSNKFFIYMYDKYDLDIVNFRIFSAPVLDAIKNTPCDVPKRN